MKKLIVLTFAQVVNVGRPTGARPRASPRWTHQLTTSASINNARNRCWPPTKSEDHESHGGLAAKARAATGCGASENVKGMDSSRQGNGEENRVGPSRSVAFRMERPTRDEPTIPGGISVLVTKPGKPSPPDSVSVRLGLTFVKTSSAGVPGTGRLQG